MTRFLHALVCAASAAFIAVLAVLFVFRVRYPYELEWLEGWMLDAVRQVLDGRPLYGPPSLDFVGSVYNPLYFYASALLSLPMGVGFASARLISVLSTFGLFALLIFRLKPAESGNRQPATGIQYRATGNQRTDLAAGLVAAGLYAASYRFSGAWMDIARNDSLFLLLLVGAFLIGRDSKSVWQDVLCGVAYALAFFTKQTALAVLAVLFTGQFFIDRRRYWIQWLTFGVTTAASFAALDWTSNGWYSYYTLDSPLHFVPHPDQLYFLGQARLKLLPGLLALAVLIVYALARRWTPTLVGEAGDETRERVDVVMWSTAMLAIGLVVSSWAVFRQRGTFDNVFMPACLGLAIGAGIAYHEFFRGVREGDASSARTPEARLVGFGAVALLILQQFTLFAYNPLLHVPSEADRQLGDRFISSLRALPGSVLVWAHGHYGELAGKGRYVHDISFIDAAGQQSHPPRSEDNRRRRQQVYDTVLTGVKTQVFDWIVIDRPGDLWAPYYLMAAKIDEAPREFTGRDTRVGMLLTRNPIVQGGRLETTDPRWNFLFGAGWGAPQGWGRPLIGEGGTVAIALERGNGYQLQAGLQLQCAEAPPGGVIITVWWDDQVLAQRTLAECGVHQLSATLPADSIAREGNALRLDAKWESGAGSIGLTTVNLVPLAR